jgi:hypothetical protein
MTCRLLFRRAAGRGVLPRERFSPLCRSVRLERQLPLCGPKRPRLFALIAFELISHREQRTEDGATVIAGQACDVGFDHPRNFNAKGREMRPKQISMPSSIGRASVLILYIVLANPGQRG